MPLDKAYGAVKDGVRSSVQFYVHLKKTHAQASVLLDLCTTITSLPAIGNWRRGQAT